MQRLCTRDVQHQSPVMSTHIELLLRKKGMMLSTLRRWMAEKCVDTAALETNPPNLSGKTKGLHWIRGNSSSILEGAQSQPLIAWSLQVCRPPFFFGKWNWPIRLLRGQENQGLCWKNWMWGEISKKSEKKNTYQHKALKPKKTTQPAFSLQWHEATYFVGRRTINWVARGNSKRLISMEMSSWLCSFCVWAQGRCSGPNRMACLERRFHFSLILVFLLWLNGQQSKTQPTVCMEWFVFWKLNMVFISCVSDVPAVCSLI